MFNTKFCIAFIQRKLFLYFAVVPSHEKRQRMEVSKPTLCHLLATTEKKNQKKRKTKIFFKDDSKDVKGLKDSQ